MAHPLDSITNGFGSSDFNGYRLDLVENLNGNTVNMIGEQVSGTPPNNHHEGHNGATISDLASFASVQRSLA